MTVMDPFMQTFNLTTSYPPTLDSTISVAVDDVNDYLQYALLISIEYAVQAGACFVLFLILLLTARSDKRLSPVFLLNITAVVLSAIRNVIQITYFTGPFYNFYAYVSGDYSRVPQSAYAASVAGVILVLILLICIEASLILQVHAVSAAMQSYHRRILMIFGFFIALAAISLRFVLTVYNIRSILDAESFQRYKWIAIASNAVVTGSICFFSAVFVGKLIVLLYKRRQMGIIEWGPMQIVAIGGCQTLTIPAVFAILQNFTAVPELGSFVLTLTAIFMPLSSLWATATVGNRMLRSQSPKPNARSPFAEKRRTYDSYGSDRPIAVFSPSVKKQSMLTSLSSRTDTFQSQSTARGEVHAQDLVDDKIEGTEGQQLRNWLGVVIGGDDVFKHGHELSPDLAYEGEHKFGL